MNREILDPIEQLQNEHKDALKVLGQLEDAASSIQELGFTKEAFEHIAGAIRFFGKEFRQHDRKEEQFLFPMIEQRRPGVTQEYRVEHRELWGAVGHLLSCVSDVENGYLRGSSVQELVLTARQIVELLRRHIRSEEEQLFPLVKKSITPEEYERLLDSFLQSVEK